MHPLTNVSPIDGRYHEDTSKLSRYFSEMALMRYRLMVEIEYFIALGHEKGVPELPPFSATAQRQLRALYERFSVTDAREVKDIEADINHDTKAVEYFLKARLAQTDCAPFVEYIHFALTSEDVDNLAFTLMWRDAVRDVFLPTAAKVYHELRSLALVHKAQPMLAMTHGQSATPTTFGKELFVFVQRLARQLRQLKDHQLLGKFNGATGTWSAHAIAYPDVDWIAFSKKFVSSLGLIPNIVTTQIEPHDSLIESYQTIYRIDSILLDFVRDVWMYMSRGIVGQMVQTQEVGSSTMPHKVNPIFFENAEAHLGIARAYVAHLAEKLPISRMQRDLSDKTTLRHQGVPLAHSLIACKSILKGLSRLTVHSDRIREELNDHWEVLAEAIQTALRRLNYPHPYEALKALTRGERMTKEMVQGIIAGLDIPENEKEKLRVLTPEGYIGLAERLVK